MFPSLGHALSRPRGDVRQGCWKMDAECPISDAHLWAVLTPTFPLNSLLFLCLEQEQVEMMRNGRGQWKLSQTGSLNNWSPSLSPHTGWPGDPYQAPGPTGLTPA